MKNLFHSFVLVALIPLIALALEPTNPPGICDRFTSAADIEQCNSRTAKDDVDWYAVTVCNLQKDDQSFWKCWDSIQEQSFNPATLDKCGEESEMTDIKRQECVNSSRGNREPASKATFQPLNISKPAKSKK